LFSLAARQQGTTRGCRHQPVGGRARDAGRRASGAPGTALEILSRLLAEGLITLTAQQSDAFDAAGVFTSAQAAVGATSLQDNGYVVRIARRAARERKPADPSGKRTLLIIDDDPYLVKLLQTYLKLEGYAPRSAATRDDIIALLRAPLPPDLVLLDVTLAELDGFEVLARMRQHALLRDVPVIMLTGQATRAAVIKGLRAGCEGYFTKPFEVDVLVKAVALVLGVGLAQSPGKA
jgi:CheY-like chemotaxis protein